MKGFRGFSWRDWCILAICVMTAAGAYIVLVAAEERDPAFTAGLDAFGQRDIPSAVVNLEEALRRTDAPAERAEINLLLGLAYRWTGQTDKAIAIYKAVFDYRPDFEASFPEYRLEGLNPASGLANCYRAKRDWDAVLKWAERRLEQNPDADVMMLIAEEARRKLGQAGMLTAGPMVVARDHYVRGSVTTGSNTLLVSARKLAQRLGVIVTPKSNKQLEISSDERRLVLSAGSRQAVLDGATIALPVAPVMVKGELLVPLRFVAETFGRRVTWDARARIARVR